MRLSGCCKQLLQMQTFSSFLSSQYVPQTCLRPHRTSSYIPVVQKLQSLWIFLSCRPHRLTSHLQAAWQHESEIFSCHPTTICALTATPVPRCRDHAGRRRCADHREGEEGRRGPVRVRRHQRGGRGQDERRDHRDR